MMYVPLKSSVRPVASSSAAWMSAVQSLALAQATTRLGRRRVVLVPPLLPPLVVADPCGGSGPQHDSCIGGSPCASSSPAARTTAAITAAQSMAGVEQTGGSQ